MLRTKLALAAVGPFFLVLGASSLAAAKTLEIAASFTVLADVVAEVGGTHVAVHGLVGPNGDPHAYEPSPTDARLLRSADLVFVSGDGLEGWMDRLITASGYQGTPIIASDGVPTRKMQEDGAAVIDPHVWNNPAYVEIWVKNIEAALAATDPEDASDFAANAAAYTKTLQELDAYARSRFASVPAADRKILTSHDAFGYLSDAYGVAFLSPQGLSTESDASAQGVAKLIDQIKAQHIRVYFFENSNDPRLVEQIAAATGAKPGGQLYVEALSKKDGPAATYVEMFRYNVDQLANAMKKTS